MKVKIKVRDLFSLQTDVRQYLKVWYSDDDTDHKRPIIFLDGDRMDEIIEVEAVE